MRTTQSSTYRTILQQLSVSSNRLSELQTRAATGKKMNKASDDPSAIRPVLHARSQILSSDRYVRTMESGLDRINATDGYLDNMENIWQRMHEIAVATDNGSLDEQNRTIYAEEVAQLRTELLDSVNATMDGKYLFSGFEVHTKPFVENPAYDPVLDPRPILYQGDNGSQDLEIGPRERVQINLTGNAVFLGDEDFDGLTDPGNLDIFAVMSRVEEALRANDPLAVDAEIDNIKAAAEQLRSQRSLLGNTGRRLEAAKERMSDTSIEMQLVLSRYEDADIVNTIASLTQQESAFQAALSVTGRLSDLSILNYI